MLRTFDSLEVGSNLLFRLRAADVALSLIVVERNIFSKSKSQPAALMSGQPIEQVSTSGIFRFASFALFGWRLFAVGQLADILELPLPGLPVSQNNGRFPTLTIEVDHKLMHFGDLLQMENCPNGAGHSKLRWSRVSSGTLN